MRTVLGKLLAVTAVTASLAGLGSGSAAADPPGGVVPAPNSIVGVGSQTTAPLLNQLTADYNAYLTSLGNVTAPRAYSFDAVGTPIITLKTGLPAASRPLGLQNGLVALQANPNGVDFVRSDRGRLPSDPATNSFVALAKDAVSWAATSGGNAPVGLTSTELKGIYECTFTNWQQINPLLPNAVIKPFLPPADSGTRLRFLRAVGGGTSVIPGGCVTTTPVENQGLHPLLNDPDAVFPYSVGHYIGQVYFGRSLPGDAPGPLTVRAVNGIPPVDTTTTAINAPFAGSLYGGLVHDVVRQAAYVANTPQGTALRNFLGTTGWICGNATAVTDIKTHGFLPLPAGLCGTLS
ncbi:substrate-binding domain-containing protein [Streptomyces sp. BE303]|uniref:substrate-binding domain-containing protein n=1 Tax=Streptomyces sp. BE303 TaxID=3002528 RepID=UPI002E75A468|nr:substrate-binding domain-containing protein [Streptomyces sp. BE303]MED7950648.1 substrate-binding domain-containing protein [Streptomyces sp. BE303]